jgi:outer membrane receptor protein involved in Fe transport
MEAPRAVVFAAVMVLAPILRAQPATPQPPSQPGTIPPYSETIEVTASRAPQPVLDAPVSMTVIDEKQIRNSPADNYADLLRGVPGLNVVQTSTRDVSIRARGATKVAENSQIALIDGRSIYLDYYGIVVWDYLPVSLDEIKSVEILRGPGSAVWGANAMSGVINLLTKSPQEMAGGTLTLRAGERGTREGSLLWAKAHDRVSYKLSAAFLEQDPWPRDNRLPDGTPFPFGYSYKNEGTRQPKADGRLDFDLTSSSKLSFRAGYGGTSGIFHSNVGPFLIQRGAHVAYGEVDYSNGTTEAKVYLNHLDGDAPNLLNGLQFSFLMNTYVAEVTRRRTIGNRQMLIYGASARSNRFNLSIAPNRRSRNDAGMFVEDIIDFAPWLEINAGVRFDHFDVVGSFTSPRLSFIAKPARNQAIRLAVNRAYRAPTLVENFLTTAVPNVVILPGAQPVFFYSSAMGNPDLASESALDMEIGYSARLRDFYVDAAIYRHTIRNNITFFPSAFYSSDDPPAGWPLPPSTVPAFALPKTFAFFNVGRVRQEGFDLSAETRPRSDVVVRGSYTYQRQPVVDARGSSIPLVVNRPPRSLAHIGVQIERQRWFGAGAVSYSGRAFWSDVLDSRFWGYTRAYTLTDATLGVHLRSNTDLSIRGTNIFDQRVKQHIFGDVIGRKVVGELHYRF